MRFSAERGLCVCVAAAIVACGNPSPPHDAGDTFDAPATDGADALDVHVEAAAAVGVTTRMLVDSTRGTPANGDAGATTSRSLPTDIYYPAIGSPGTTTPEAPLDTTRAPYPMVLVVHGSASSRTTLLSLVVSLASSGYIVAAADFPLTAFDTPGGASDLHVDDQVGDLAFIATQLIAFSASATDTLAASLAPDAGYGVVGHSTGGTVALLALYAFDMHDPRVQAGVALAPCACFFGDAFFSTRSLPLLVMAGTDDLFVPIRTNGARAYALAGPPRAMTTLVGGTHLFFTDIDLADSIFAPVPTNDEDDIALALLRYGGGTVCLPVPPAGTDRMMTFDTQHAETQAWVRAFLDATMRGDPSRLRALESASDPLNTLQHDGI